MTGHEKCLENGDNTYYCKLYYLGAIIIIEISAAVQTMGVFKIW